MRDLLRNGYRSINLLDNDGNKGFISVHVVVCTLFNGKCPEAPEGVKQMTVNHKNGDKLNCHKDNLEWSTNSENILHAYKTRLNKASQHIKLTDIETSETIELHSLRELTRWMGNPSLSGTAIVNQYKDKLYLDKWRIELIGEHINSSGQRTSVSFYGIEMSDRTELIKFKSGHECSGILGISRRSIGRSLSSEGNKEVNGWRFAKDPLKLSSYLVGQIDSAVDEGAFDDFQL